MDDQSWFAGVLSRVSMHAAGDASLFDDRYLRGIEMIREAGMLTALFELGTHPDLAAAGLTSFEEFLRDPAGIGKNLAQMDGLRENVYGPLP